MRTFVFCNFAFAIQRQSGDKWSHHNLSARRPTMDKKLPPLSSLKPFDLLHFTFTFFLRNSLQSGFWIGPTYPNLLPIYRTTLKGANKTSQELRKLPVTWKVKFKCQFVLSCPVLSCLCVGKFSSI